MQHDRLLDMIDVVVAHDRAEAEHDPSSMLRTFVTLRDQTCRGVGCPRTATSCELDHRQDWAHGGDTAAWNLDAQSTRCHHAKHDGWTVERDDTSGMVTWTSPLGSTYTRQPAWDPPPPIPADAVIPTPRVVERAEITPDRTDDRPLWRDGSARPAPPKTSRPTATWDDGPPPF